MKREFTREEFHALVWSKPMTHLAKEFGLSDVALHKTCRKHGIPTPPLGWWAKKAAGKAVAVTPLPQTTARSGGRITIANVELRNEPAPVVAARKKARALMSSAAVETATPPHPVVERTLAKLRKAKASADDGLLRVKGPDLIHAEVAPASVDRLELALARLVSALRVIGADIVPGEKTACVALDGEKITFSIREALKREKHVLTPKEEAEQQAWERRQERRRQTDPWIAHYSLAPRFPEWDHHPAGQLSFELEHFYMRDSSPRRSFRDGKNQKLETLAGEIATGVAITVAAMKEDRLRREEEAREREEARHRRELALRANHVEERREAVLSQIIDELAALEHLRRLLDALGHRQAGFSGRVREFVAFAGRRLAESEAALSAEGLERRFGKDRLFGDDDDHDFRLPHWH